MLSLTYYAQNYAGIIHWSLVVITTAMLIVIPTYLILIVGFGIASSYTVCWSKYS